MELVRYFHSASMRGEESRQVLYLVGPVGSGKSSLMETLKKALEQHPPVYVLKDCPMREEPMHLIPKHLRPKFSEILGVNIEGDLCPICRYRLIHEYKGEYENFPVITKDFSIRARNGIAVEPPVDPNNQDTSVLVGSVDISKMDLYPEDDPWVLSLNGAFNAGNRGLVEFIEIFKNDVEYLHTILTATQEKSIPAPGKNSMIYFDGIILAHSNKSEWNKFKSDHTNEAILDRIVKIEVPYCLELPNMERKKFSYVETEHSHKRWGIQRKGIPPRLARKRSMQEKIKRQKSMERSLRELEQDWEQERFPFREEDLRYQRVKPDLRPQSNAVVICMMDNSGSMYQSKKFLARSFFFYYINL